MNDARPHSLVESEKRYGALLLDLSDSLVRLDRSGRILDAHLAAGAQVLVQVEEIPGVLVDARWPREEADRLRDAIAIALDGEEPQIIEVLVPVEPRDSIALNIRLARYTSDEVIAVWRDVTELRTLRERLLVSEQMAVVGKLAAGAAQELSGPLTYSVANIALARNAVREMATSREPQEMQAVVARLAAILREAEEGAERVQRIVTDLRSLSRVDQERRPVDLARAVEASLRMVSHELTHRARVVRDLGSVRPVLANEAGLCRVLMSLLLNAARAIAIGTPSGNEVRVTTCELDDRAVVEIHDSGCGIEPDQLHTIFEPFFSAKGASRERGLELAACRGVVQSFNGELAVESQVGRGSTFRVKLPLAVEPVRSGPGSAPKVPVGQRAKVLFIDDEQPIVEVARRLLGREYDVTTLMSGVDVLERIAGGDRYDAIFCDLMMPEMTGMDLYERLTTSCPEQAARMVFLTGGVFTAQARQFVDRPGIELIDKPFSLGVLMSAVDKKLAVPRKS